MQSMVSQKKMIKIKELILFFKKPGYLWTTLFLMLFLGIFLQSHMYISHDVSWHLLAAERLLKGGTYQNNFVDINPPAILYILFPVIWLKHLTGLGEVVLLHIYLFSLALMSLIVSYFQVIKQGLIKSVNRHVLIITLAFILLIMPADEFGQRDHLVLIFIFPYLINIINYEPRKKKHSIGDLLIGLLAGIGITINIEYFFLIIALESYLVIRNRLQYQWFRLDNMTILLLFVIYISTLFTFTRDYIHFVLPLVSFLFLSAYNQSWTNMLVAFPTLSLFFTILVILYYQHIVKLNRTIPVFLISGFIFFIQFIVTRKLWYYHQLGTWAMILLLLGQLLCDIDWKSKWNMIPAWTVFLSTITLLFYSIMSLVKANWIDTSTSNNPNPLSTLTNDTRLYASHTSLYVFTTLMWPARLIYYVPINYASRFGALWMIPGIVALSNQILLPVQKKKLIAAKQFQLKAVTEDFIQYQPKWVYVDVNLDKPYIQDHHFDYINFFSQNLCFKRIWKNYHYVKSMWGYAIYRKSQKTLSCSYPLL